MDTMADKKVGIFVIVGFAILVSVIFIIGGNKSLFSSTYELKVHFKQVQGLGKGSVVQLVGLPIGNVKNIEFDKDSYQLIVVLSINSQYKNRLTQGSVAGVRTQGALGDKFIYITPGSPNNPPLLAGEVMSTEDGGDLFTMLSEKGTDITQIFDVISDLSKMMKDINGNNQLRDIVANLKSTTEDLKSFTNDLNHDRSGQNLQVTISKLQQIVSKIEDGSGTLGAIINDPSLYKKLQQLTGPQSVSPIKSAIRQSIRETEN